MPRPWTCIPSGCKPRASQSKLLSTITWASGKISRTQVCLRCPLPRDVDDKRMWRRLADIESMKNGGSRSRDGREPTKSDKWAAGPEDGKQRPHHDRLQERGQNNSHARAPPGMPCRSRRRRSRIARRQGCNHEEARPLHCTETAGPRMGRGAAGVVVTGAGWGDDSMRRRNRLRRNAPCTETGANPS